MKQLYLFSLVVLSLFSACQNTDIDDIKKRVEELEKSKSVTGIKFSGTKMVLTYSTSEKDSIEMPTGLDGLNGTNGTNGAGIQSISYNENTNELTITLTNGNISVFKIITGSGGMSAVLISDVNGKMYITSVNLGAVPIATISYDANFNITKMVSKTIEDGVILKSFEIAKQYTDNKLSNLQFINYATKKEVDYATEWLYNYNGQDTVVSVDMGEFFYKSNGDSTYRFFKIQGQIDANHWNYTIYPFAIKKNYSYSYFPYNYYAKYNETIAYGFDYITQIGFGPYEVWYVAYVKYTKKGTYNVGEKKNEDNIKVECNASGNPEKFYESVGSTGTPTSYILFTYNGNNLVTKSEEYNKVGESWVKSAVFLTFEYNSSNLLTFIKRTNKDASIDTVFKTVYDTKGNPLEIYTWNGASSAYYRFFDPIAHPEDPWTSEEIVTIPEGLQLVAKIEYDYSYKNFLGNTLGAVIPELQNYKLFNAPIRVSHTQSYAYASIEYKNFNDSGYPETLFINAYDEGSDNYRLELSLDYIKKP